MLRAEAVRIAELLGQAGEVSPLLNVGSSTARFRTVEHPFVDATLFAPLREAEVAVAHLDPKGGEGVGIAGDILDPALRAELARRGYRSLLLANVLEHVRDPAALAAACEDVVGSGGLILVTVPCSYPYHADPLDTGYRPAPAELAALFARSEVRVAEVLEGPSYAQAIREAGSSPWREAARTVGALLLAPLRPRSCLSRLDRWRWYRRPFRVSIVVLAVR